MNPYAELVADYYAARAVTPTSAPSPSALLDRLFAAPDAFVFDCARAAEMAMCSEGEDVPTLEIFSERADTFMNPQSELGVVVPGAIARGKLTPLDWFSLEHGAFYEFEIACTMMSFELSRIFVLHRDATSWTLARLGDAQVQSELVLEGVGAFRFDDYAGWRSTKLLPAAWSEKAVTLMIVDQHPVPSPAPLETARAACIDVLGRADFKPALEARVRHIYETYYYEDLVAEHEAYGDAPPVELKAAHEVWGLIETVDVRLHEGAAQFEVSMRITFDPDHELDLHVAHWALEEPNDS